MKITGIKAKVIGIIIDGCVNSPNTMTVTNNKLKK